MPIRKANFKPSNLPFALGGLIGLPHARNGHLPADYVKENHFANSKDCEILKAAKLVDSTSLEGSIEE